MIPLTFDLAVNYIERAIEEKGADFVYAAPDSYMCANFTPDGLPSCIVGYALHYHGVDWTDPKYRDSRHASVTYVSVLHGLDIEPKALRFLVEVQSSQDHGNSWGEALSAGLDSVEYFQ